MKEIAGLLPKTDETLYFFNRCHPVDEDEPIVEAFDSKDPVTVWAGLPEKVVKARVQKNIQNNSDYDIVVVARTKDGWPIFFEGKDRPKCDLKAVNFDSFRDMSKKIELYR